MWKAFGISEDSSDKCMLKHWLWVIVLCLQRIDFLQDQEFLIDGEVALAPAYPTEGLEIIQNAGNLVFIQNTR